ncbi:MAG: hypothetical protein ACKO8U_18335 [Pirellula sp.]
MNEMRYDWLGDRWVIFAPNRLLRPDNYHDRAHRRSCQTTTSPGDGHTSNGQLCPFCLGAEDQTPPATLTLRTDRQSTLDWSVRVVPNKFPAIDAPEEFCLRSDQADRSTPASDLFMRKHFATLFGIAAIRYVEIRHAREDDRTHAGGAWLRCQRRAL